ncbi:MULTISPECIES: hypothetical protein [unclassified Rickettsia]|uniref:hypothetical protein n=1 Tax=unclassified Rickettsia TaxID=114295 RepID=UPI003132F636
MTKKSLDSRLRGNDIRHFFRAMQQRLQRLAMTILVAMQQHPVFAGMGIEDVLIIHKCSQYPNKSIALSP